MSAISPPVISGTPANTLIDEVVEVVVRNLQPREKITVSSELTEDGITFRSHAFYTASDHGEVRLSKHESTGGMYTGVEPMGLVWSLLAVQDPDSRKGLRLMQKDVTRPMTLTYRAHRGHAEPQNYRDALCSVSVARSYLSPAVERVCVRHGRLRGTLFIPRGASMHGGVIDLFGTAGGLVEFRAALLASRGFAALALAYFMHDDLPGGFDEVDLDYFQEAADWLLAHPRVYNHGVGLVGVSKGAELGIQLACYFKQFIATVAINGISFITWSDHYVRGEKLEGIKPYGSLYRVQHTEWGPQWGATYSDSAIRESRQERQAALFPVERADQTHFLLVHGSDDLNVPPRAAVDLPQRLRRHGKHNYTVLMYPGAGHLIEPPYSPFTRWSYHKAMGDNIIWGGSLRPHAHAQEHSWPAILQFLRRRLTPDPARL